MLSGYGKYAVTAGYDGQRGFRNTANFVNSAMPSGTQGRHVGKPTELSVLDGIIPSPDDDNMLRLMQRDMYLHDPVVGSIVDLSSQLLFGDFSISGVPDRAIIQKFQSSLENMRIKSYLNGVSLDYFVDGAHLGVMNFDKDERIFDGIIPQDIINADITPIPYYGHSPIVDLKPSEAFKKLLKNSSDPRVKRVIDQLPKILQGLSKGVVKLQPEAVLYVPRKASTYMGIGISALRRLIPLFTLEKALIRGTVELVHRRQSGIKHIRCLTGDTLISKDGRLVRLDQAVKHEIGSLEPGTAIDVDFFTKGKYGAVVKVDKWIYQGYKSVLKLKTSNGYALTGTPDHRIQVLDSNLELVWKEMQDLTNSDMLCIDRNCASLRMRNQLELPDLDTVLKAKAESRRKGGKAKRAVKIPTHLTPSLAYLIGALLSEGSMTEGHYYVANTNVEFLQRINKAHKKALGFDVQILQGKSMPYMTFYCVQGVEILRHLGMQTGLELNPDRHPQKMSWRKKFPWSILQAGEKEKAAFLGAYLDADGCIYHAGNGNSARGVEVSFSTSSYHIAKNMMLMLSDLGFKAFVSGRNLGEISSFSGKRVKLRYGRKSRKEYRVTVHYCDSLRFIRKLEKWSIKARDFQAINEGFDIKYSGIPSEPVIKFIESRVWKGNYDKARISKNSRIFVTDSGEKIEPSPAPWKAINDLKQCSRLTYDYYKAGRFDELLEFIETLSPSFYNKLVNLFSVEYFYDTPASIIQKRKKRHVYDLSIAPGNAPAFVANSIVVHNCGDDMWVATSEELSGIANLFSAADADPIGAFVATRPSVDIQDVASIGDSWRWTDVIEQATTLKFRALGFSESLLSGEATFSNAEQGMNVFVKQQTSLRDYITRTIFYEKIFPYLSVVNGYEKKEYKESSRVYRENGSFFAEIADSKPLREIDLNIDDYYIPTVTWHSSLRPEGDGNYMELLDALDKKGLPIPMRMMAAALGVSITDILYGMDEDIEIRQKLSEYREAIKEYLPQTEEIAGIAEFGNKRKTLAERDFTELSERMTPNTINGHRYVSTAEGRRQKNEQANRVMAQAAAEFGKKMNKITQSQHTVPIQKQPLESLFGTF